MTSRRLRGMIRVGRVVIGGGFAALLLISSIGCQAEYAGLTLPTGKYLYDDVQYFPPGPDFPMARTQAALRRARLRSEGLDPSNISQPIDPAIDPGMDGQNLAPDGNIPIIRNPDRP